MKKLILLVLSLTLAGCSALQAVPSPTSSPPPTLVPPTPQVILVTVLVTVIPTQLPTDTPTPVPTDTSTPTLPLPSATSTAGTLSPEPTLTPATETATPADLGAVAVPTSLNGPVFSSITFSTGRFSLRCEPKAVTFDLIASDTHVTNVEFYYRIREKTSTYFPDWSRGDNMEWDGSSHFWLTFNGTDVSPDNRKENGWFDVQFIGLNALGQVVGRSAKIEQLLTYTIDCP